MAELERRLEGVYSSLVHAAIQAVPGSALAYFKADEWAEGRIKGTATLVFVNEFAEDRFRREYARRLRGG